MSIFNLGIIYNIYIYIYIYTPANRSYDTMPFVSITIKHEPGMRIP